MIVLIEKNKNNKIEFTKEELEKLLKDAREEGHNEGYKEGFINGYNSKTSIITSPTGTYLDTTTINKPVWTCED